jgi:hypothetical protein
MDRVSRSALYGFGCLVVLVYFPLAVVYWQMTATLPIPESSPPDPKSYQQVLATIGKLQQLNPQELTTAEIRNRQSNPAKADSIVQAYRALAATLKIPASVPLDMKKDGRPDYVSERLAVIQMLRSVARSMDHESGALEVSGNYDEAAELGLTNVRLGAIEQCGGTIVDSLVGIAIEGVGVYQIGRIRQNLSPDAVGELIPGLEAIDRNRELSEITISREAAWSDEAYKWRTALLREGPRVLAGANRTGFTEHLSSARAFESAAGRRDALLRLLITELTIRAYQIAEGRLPESLNDLCPRYFSSVPVDPFSGAALIYRRVDDTYVLYSVGLDQKDNGGKFGTISDLYGSGGFDLNLDILN